MKSIKMLVLLALTTFVGTELSAQINTPAPSPASHVEQMIGLSKVTLDYSRPSARGRKVFGELVPYGEVWRTGANASTDITFSDDVMLNGNKVPAGKYALYTIPGEKEWTIIIYKNTELWGSGGYDSADDLVRFTVEPMNVPMKYETFTIAFTDMADRTSATLNIMWENTIASFKIVTNPDPQIMAQIKEMVIDTDKPTQNALFAAADYYYANDKDLKMAHKWIKMANGSDAKFWMVHLQAKIEAKMGEKEMALATAKKSMQMAKDAGNMDYVRLNEKLISEM